ncbi:MAG: hypothetical protein HQK50_11805 [Oligoflexia bacterium]|nr:hypothetical protein [Oligoflexia bacterium]MBF0366248.1 hypothetical protein [Oligoflexia bacterium]
MERNKVAGLSLSGGRHENFYLVLLEHFQEMDRWFLSSLTALKEEEQDGESSDEMMRRWASKHQCKMVVADIPLSLPFCQSCHLLCKGEEVCPVSEVVSLREVIAKMLESDHQRYNKNPKAYERDRNQDDLIWSDQQVWDKLSDQHILSRAFKRRLKRGIAPYWNRPIDLWLWGNYYDQMLSLFQSAYDSFGATSLMKLFKYQYWKRYSLQEIAWYESHASVVLLELLRVQMIPLQRVRELCHLELGANARLKIIEEIERKLKIFIYQHDIETMVKNPKAFASFLLALSGKQMLHGRARMAPKWALNDPLIEIPLADDRSAHFIAPIF